MKQKFTEKDYQYIRDNYLTKTSSEISKIIGCSRSLVLKVWIDSGLKGKDKSRQYYCDFNYFEKIDSNNKAYILGFIAADGNIYERKGHQKQLRLSLQKDDVHILKDILKEIKSNHPIKYFINKKGKEYVSFTIVSDKLCNDIINIGILPQKTKTIKLSNLKIPEQYVFDFIRGYFDGDGSIFIDKKKIKIRIIPSCFEINIAGFIDNLKDFQEKLSKYNINSFIVEDKRTGRSQNFGSLRICANKDKYYFLKNIYNDFLKLKRKFLLAKQFIDLIENNSKYNNIVKNYAVHGQISSEVHEV